MKIRWGYLKFVFLIKYLNCSVHYENMVLTYPLFNPAILLWLLPLLIWDAVWKGIALWKSGKNNQLAWFICIFIFNTVGILPIIYLAFFQKDSKVSKKSRR